MSNRGTQDSPNTRNPERPARKPSRLDQFADDVFESTVEFAKDLSAIRRDDDSGISEKEK